MKRLDLQNNNKFGLLVFTGSNASFTDDEYNGSFKMRSLRDLEIDPMFEDHMGKTITERLKVTRNVIFILERPSDDLQTLNGENIELLNRLEALRKAILMVCKIDYQNCILLTGSVIDNNIDVRQAQTLAKIYGFLNTISLSKRELEDIDCLYQAINDIPENEFAIFKYGFYCLTHAPGNYFVEENLHQHVRSLEAIVHCFGTKQFADRIMTLCEDQCSSTRDVFIDIRQMRNEIEHLKRPPEDKCRRSAMFIRYFANKVFQNVLLDRKLLEQHRNIDDLENCWREHRYHFSPKVSVKEIVEIVNEHYK